MMRKSIRYGKRFWAALVMGSLGFVATGAYGGESLPADAWNGKEIRFAEQHRDQLYRLDDPASATGVRFSVPATLQGETLTLEAPAQISGSGILLAPLAGTNGLCVARSGVSSVFPQVEPALLWTDVWLTDDMVVTGEICGNMIGGKRLCPVEMFFFEKSGDTATAQFHCYDDTKPDGSAKYVKAFKLQFDQVASNVTVKVLWARYADAALYGTNLETSYMGEYGRPYTTSLDDSAKAIGITNLRVVDNVVLGGVFPAGEVSLETGRVAIRPQQAVTITNAIGGRVSELRFEGTGTQTSLWTYADFVGTNEQKILENVCIDTLTFVSARMSGGWLNHKDDPRADFYGCFVKKSPGTNIVYVQYFDLKKNSTTDKDYTKMVAIQFRQVGTDVYMKARGRCFAEGDWRGKDSSGLKLDERVSTSATMDGYGIHDVVFSYRSGIWPTTLAGGNRNTLPRGTRVVVDGTVLSITGDAMLPTGHDLVLTNGAEVAVDLKSFSAFADGSSISNRISLFNGSSYTVGTPWAFGNLTEMTLDASTFVATFQSQEKCSCQYVERLTLRNGSRTKGWPIRVGWYTVESYVRSQGTGPNVIENGVMASRRMENRIPNEYVFDTETDLHILGPLMDTPRFEGINWVKAGAARLVLFGAAGNTVCPFSVRAGTLVLATNGVFEGGTNDVDVTLAGGILDGGAFTNHLGSLTVTDDSVLYAGEGVISFADSSQHVWTPGAGLSVTGAAARLRRGHVRFANREDGGAGLVIDQLKAIRYNGDQSVQLDSDGWLVSRPISTLIVIR